MPQFSIPAVLYRGGTSRGVYFHKKDLPEDTVLRDRILMTVIDSWNATQIDGLGGGTSSSSKACVISPSDREGVDVDWTFYQLGVAKQLVDAKGTCGNLMSAVGAFAIDEGLVPVAAMDTVKEVIVYNTNIKKKIRMVIPVYQGKTKVTGDYQMAGIVKSGAKLVVSILEPGGENTGSIHGIGIKASLQGLTKKHEVTFSDVINPFVFTKAEDFGLTGTEAWSSVANDAAVLAELEELREEAAVLSGIATDKVDAKEVKQNIPKIAMLAPAATYVTTNGETVQKEEVDLLVKVVSMGSLHKNSPASGLYNIAVASATPGTVVHELVGPKEGMVRTIRIGHPGGVTEVRIELDEKEERVIGVGMERTVRRIMKGEVFIPEA